MEGRLAGVAAKPVAPGTDGRGGAAERQASRAAADLFRAGDEAGRHAAAAVDFSQVRIHTDHRASAAARSLRADAFTQGSAIAFRDGKYAPSTPSGQRLLAHELTHVLQQRSAPRQGVVQLQEAPGGPAGAAGLSDEMLRQIARRLHEAMTGPGTDEEAIYSSLAGRTQEQLDAISQTYQDLFHRSLLSHLQSELNEGELRQLSLFSPEAASAGAAGATADVGRNLADMVARQLDRAIRGPGTDEDSIFAALTGRTEAERQAIREAYSRLTGNQLEADLRDDLSGADLTRALRLLNQGLLLPEDEIYLAVEGLGTDEDTIFRVLGSLAGDAAALQGLAQEYERKYGDLIGDLRSDLTAEEYERARAILVPAVPDAQTDDCGVVRRRQVREAHARAMEMLRAAITASATATDPATQAAAAAYFDITLPTATDQDRRLWAHVRTALSSMLIADRDVVYECEPAQSFFHGACLADNIAVSLGNIHLCPLFWTENTTVDARAATFLHEWGHKFGTGINRIFETYCWEPGFTTLPASQRVTWPDAYMFYVVDLATGHPPAC